MTGTKMHFHGSDLELIEKYYNIPKNEITSFSANVNPLGSSPLMKKALIEEISCVEEYPDRAYEALRRSIATYINSDMDYILPGNGSTELISLFIRLIAPSSALIISPTYFEYERELALSGCSHDYFHLRETDDFVLNTDHLIDALPGHELLIFCNPNNPTSSVAGRKQLKTVLDFCRDNNIIVMIDETYSEFTDESDEATAVPLLPDYKNLIVLRGTSKFFACPGLRLGYSVCSDTGLLKKAKELQNPWSINSPAAKAGEMMFTDTEYIDRTRKLISEEKQRIYDILRRKNDIKVYEPHANFVLVRLLDRSISAHALFEKAIKQKLMIRDCSEFESLDGSFIRFCFMGREADDKLLKVLFG